jgi:hypothetical protein
MPSIPASIEKLTSTLSMSEYPSTSGHAGFWLYDSTRGMNLAMREKSREAAYLKALQYYQRLLAEIETKYKTLDDQVSAFISRVSSNEEEA